MLISKISISNFRLLQQSSLDLREKLSLLVGKNNTGKTSLLVLFEKFFEQSKRFDYNDFPISLREKIHTIDEHSDIEDLSIRMVLEIGYDDKDNLGVLSDFILDLNPAITNAKILFECRIDKSGLLKEIPSGCSLEERKNLIIKTLRSHLKRDIYAFNDNGYKGTKEYIFEHRNKLIKKDLGQVKSLINLSIIHARREVASSEEHGDNKQPLSNIATKYFKKDNNVSNADVVSINKELIALDKTLDKTYDSYFGEFLNNAKGFIGLDKLNVVSNIQSNMLLENSSQVIYGTPQDNLPEHFNGLGYVNILYMLLEIEIKKSHFKEKEAPINILFIEEPEAHTHPQMQYRFAENISAELDDVKNLQTLITTHSPHIVSRSKFEDIRYLQLENSNVKIKNFHTELRAKYEKFEEFKFLKQYLNIQSSELFFASKVIFIEGVTERMLLPYFMKEFDDSQKAKDPKYIALAAQNLSIIEVGANAKVFAPFLEFLGIKTLIITDIDSTNKPSGEKSYCTATVVDGTHTSNETIKYFYKAPVDVKTDEFDTWFKDIKNHKGVNNNPNIRVAYQSEERGYKPRSFEDAFININRALLIENKDALLGLKNRKELDVNGDLYDDIYGLTESVLGKKSDFAASLLYLALSSKGVQLACPAYILEGFQWLQQ
ncbi:MAG: AAA family ATPase [Colwellia sp.]|nr:AAA family ATPase [Colwellia sp.]